MSRAQYIVLGIFVTLTLFCAALMIIGNSMGAYAGTKIIDAGAEGFKIAFSSLIGALAALLGSGRSTR